jgi:hypothetical protein
MTNDMIFCVVFMQEETVESLVKRFLSLDKIIVEKIEEDTVVRVIDPILSKRIQIPVKGIRCSH